MILEMLGIVLGYILKFCYTVSGNFGLAILLFTFLSKIILLPVSMWVQKNSIKMVKMQPEINYIHARNMGDKNQISEEQYKLYKKEGYKPLAGLVPLLLQLIILMGVVEAIRVCIAGFDGISMKFCGISLTTVPIKSMGTAVFIIPIMAAASAFFLCYIQNRANVLQAEQGKINKAATTAFSVVLSLYLGFFVPAGVGLYWIYSNLFAILQIYFLNLIINPKEYIDYEELEKSRKELEKSKAYAVKKNRPKISRQDKIREKEDYRRFLNEKNKQLVFYSEGKGFYKYFRAMVDTILNESPIVIHYITSDPKDTVFDYESERLRCYYIGEIKLIYLMMKMDADIVAMTTPDLEKYHIKRSKVRDDIEYIYFDHGLTSNNMCLKKNAVAYFDTVFVTNEQILKEIRAMERYNQTPKKRIVKFGSSVVDDMILGYEEYQKQKKTMGKGTEKRILIAPSWQPDNILDCCIEEILKLLIQHDAYKITVRPHPQYVRHNREYLEMLEDRYMENANVEIQMDFSSNETVYTADILITDWSGIGLEYAFATLKPVLYIDTPMKIVNPEYDKIDVVPVDIEIRNIVGISVEPEKLEKLPGCIEQLFHDEQYGRENMLAVREKYLYNVGRSGKIGAYYLMKRLGCG